MELSQAEVKFILEEIEIIENEGRSTYNLMLAHRIKEKLLEYLANK